ncbi:alpha/beta hydrolase [Paenibacillus swuensis]|uniref:Alpha/beta hydrolase n=1 Tax=Paenibacillus swuensis TaxID=1178515 RepID=A0A172TNX4_9BACL|nr:alpha/beta hydrolase [Paenibacillus swuensis]
MFSPDFTPIHDLFDIVNARVRKQPLLLASACLILLLSSCAIAFHAFIAYRLLNPIVAPIASNPLLAKGMPYEDVTFPSVNGKTQVNGWYIPSENSTQTVIFSHGYGANREEYWVPMYDLAEKLHLQNYNVVMFDYGFASSVSKQVVTGGRQESQELLGAVKLAKERGADNIYIWGFSMGAGTALQAALQTNAISGMILDSTFILDPDTLYHNLKKYINVPKYPSLSLVRWSFPFLNGPRMNQIPYERVKSTNYKMPIFMIHSTQDEKAPYSIAQGIAKNQNVEKDSNFWLVDDSMHELIYRMHSEQYLKKTFSFLRGISDPDDVQLALK